MSIKFLVLGGGVFWVWGGGGNADFIFMGAGIFLIFTNSPCKSTCLYNVPNDHTTESFS